MSLDIARINIDGEWQTNKFRLHPVDSWGEGNDRIRCHFRDFLVTNWRGRDWKVGQNKEDFIVEQ